MRDDLVLETPVEGAFSLLLTPFQQIRHRLEGMRTRARTLAACDNRTATAGLRELDGHANAVKEADFDTPEAHATARMFATAATWGKAQLEAFGQVDDERCDLCGLAGHTDMHGPWDCCHPDLVAKRLQADPGLAALTAELLPDSIRRGVAPAMGAIPDCSFWNQHYVTIDGEQAKLVGIQEDH